MRKPIFNLANILTLSRFVTAPIMLWLTLTLSKPFPGGSGWKISLTALLVLVFTMLTDLLDGTVARARGEVTNFGKIMDPVADSTFFLTLLFALSHSTRFSAHFPIWMPIIVLYREVAIQILRRYAALKGNPLPAKFSGKAKMFIQGLSMSLFFLLVFAHDWLIFTGSGQIITEKFLNQFIFMSGVVIVLVNLLSLIEYARDVPELIAEYAQPHGDKKP